MMQATLLVARRSRSSLTFETGSKIYGFLTLTQASNFVANLKFGHYMKKPPRTIFTFQIIATSISSVVQIVVLNWTMKIFDGLCDHAAGTIQLPSSRVSISG
jgi:hypothetical protein